MTMIFRPLYYITPDDARVPTELYDKCDKLLSFNIYSDDMQIYLGSVISQTRLTNNIYESTILYININDDITDSMFMKITSFYLRNLQLCLLSRDIDFKKVAINKKIHNSERFYNLFCKRYDLRKLSHCNNDTYSFELLRGDCE